MRPAKPRCYKCGKVLGKDDIVPIPCGSQVLTLCDACAIQAGARITRPRPYLGEKGERILIQRYAFRAAMIDAASYAIRNAAATAIEDGIQRKLEEIEKDLESLSDENAGIANLLVEGKG